MRSFVCSCDDRSVGIYIYVTRTDEVADSLVRGERGGLPPETSGDRCFTCRWTQLKHGVPTGIAMQRSDSVSD